MADPLLYLGDHKRCSKCGKYKDMATEYTKSRNNRFGVESYCRECGRKRKRAFIDREDRFWKFFWARTERVGKCLEWSGCYTNNMPTCRWRDKRNASLRRVVYQLAIGDLPEDAVILMSCNNSRCVSQYHMRVGTKVDAFVKMRNNQPAGDAHYSNQFPEKRRSGEKHWTRIHGNSEPLPRGSEHKMAKLTEEDVRVIRAEREANTTSASVLAKRFHISKSNVYLIVAHKAWKHVQ